MAKTKKEFENLVAQIKDISKDEKIKDKDKEITKAIAAALKKQDGEEDKKAELRALKAAGMQKHIEKFVGKPIKEHFLVNEKFGEDLEPNYFWVVGHLKDDQKVKMENIIKVVDTYSASEASSFQRNMGQSLGAIQDRIVGTLRSVGELTRQMFRFAYELKILEERLGLYVDSHKWAKDHKWDGDLKKLDPNPHEVTLKDRYINLVEGGPKNPSSVYGLGSQVGFILLPDLFLRIDVFDEKDVERARKNLDRANVNKKVIEVVTRKLSAYVHWRMATEKHLKHRWSFLLTYLKQHYNAIRMNVEWVKPYLQTVKRMQWNTELKNSADILAAIEQAILQVELLAKVKQVGDSWAVVNINMYFRTFPDTNYNPQARGDVTRHTGRYELRFTARSMTDEQIVAYQFLQEIKDFELIGEINEGLKSSLDQFGESVQKYLEVANSTAMSFDDYYKEEKILKDKKEKDKKITVEQKQESMLSPVVNLGKGFYDLGNALLSFESWKFEKKKSGNKNSGSADKDAMDENFKIYKNFKKAHKMVQY